MGPYAKQRLNLVANGKAHGQDAKASNRTWENSAVRHYKGAFENVAMVEMRTQLAIERAGLVAGGADVTVEGWPRTTNLVKNGHQSWVGACSKLAASLQIFTETMPLRT